MNKKRERFLAVILVVVVVGISIALTFLAIEKGLIDVNSSGKTKVDPRLFDLTDAIELCRDKGDEVLGKSARYIHLDDFSSRFDVTSNLFKVFFKGEFPPSDAMHKDYPDGMYIQCRVDKDKQKVEVFGAGASKQDSAKPLGAGGKSSYGFL